MRELLGGKGTNLAEMTNIGLPVPQGFTISTEACTKYYDDGRMISDENQAEIMANVDKLEAITGKKSGDKENPLLVSVCSGARAFAKLDQNGIGKLIEMAISKAKSTGNKLHYGICGEHGGNPMSVEFCHKIGLDYVSCFPFRVPIARLAAAQAAINASK